MTEEQRGQYEAQINATADVRELALLDREIRIAEGNEQDKHGLLRAIERKTAPFVHRVMHRNTTASMQFVREVSPAYRGQGGEFTLSDLMESPTMQPYRDAVLQEMGTPLEERHADVGRALAEARAEIGDYAGSEAYQTFRARLEEADSVDALRAVWGEALHGGNFADELELEKLVPVVEARIKVVEALARERQIDQQALAQQEREDEIGTEAIRAALREGRPLGGILPVGAPVAAVGGGDDDDWDEDEDWEEEEWEDDDY